eukprot:CAMPEP_0183399792 /NCGR_PEP_ID=MMETSP0370-20130417/12172_1 /TAXON_ID=268820 /ORGANISM="Peridinium aciculiferum, Strain PAER-2" /LENGTH=271 /DNA_ID=CAMNT_0025581003 /DNA_START=158 /DNA_END=974 /DNA_ORIENTATION=-
MMQLSPESTSSATLVERIACRALLGREARVEGEHPEGAEQDQDGVDAGHREHLEAVAVPILAPLDCGEELGLLRGRAALAGFVVDGGKPAQDVFRNFDVLLWKFVLLRVRRIQRVKRHALGVPENAQASIWLDDERPLHRTTVAQPQNEAVVVVFQLPEGGEPVSGIATASPWSSDVEGGVNGRQQTPLPAALVDLHNSALEPGLGQGLAEAQEAATEAGTEAAGADAALDEPGLEKGPPLVPRQDRNAPKARLADRRERHQERQVLVLHA